MKKYNKTQLTPGQEFERHIYHRDQFAHYLRFSHVLKIAKIGMNILDFGCGTGEMLEVFYRNRFRPKKYLGLDIREQTITKNKIKFEKLDFANFVPIDMCSCIVTDDVWDVITCFEVIEHVGKSNAHKLLTNIKNNCSKDTIVLLSTPVYDESVGAAKNHIIDGEIGEFGFNELKTLLEEHFEIISVNGTFASQKDYKQKLSETDKEFFERLNKYYDSNLVSVIMAPLVNPEDCRNCIWKLKKKVVE